MHTIHTHTHAQTHTRTTHAHTCTHTQTSHAQYTHTHTGTNIKDSLKDVQRKVIGQILNLILCDPDIRELSGPENRSLIRVFSYIRFWSILFKLTQTLNWDHITILSYIRISYIRVTLYWVHWVHELIKKLTCKNENILVNFEMPTHFSLSFLFFSFLSFFFFLLFSYLFICLFVYLFYFHPTTFPFFFFFWI